MNLVLQNHTFQYEIEKLLRVFYPNTKVTFSGERNGEEDFVLTALDEHPDGARVRVAAYICGADAARTEVCLAAHRRADETPEDYYERRMAVQLYDLLRALTGYTPPWGILTGVRPAKLMTRLLSAYGEDAAKSYFQNDLLVSVPKTDLACAVAKAEAPITAQSDDRSFSLYISIPFCPSRCSYCSFVSHSNDRAKKLIAPYVAHLLRELEQTGGIARDLGLRLESIYIGGGTPTALSADDLRAITEQVRRCFDFSALREYTIEAGRPDSVTKEKLLAIRDGGASRISINPQTFNDTVLAEIGRRHTGQQTLDAMALARSLGFDNINMDLIVGLPTDTFASFAHTMETTLSLAAENITVHTLSRKRAATLVTEKLPLGDAVLAEQMLLHAAHELTAHGYEPYYMYRQSGCLGNLENVGWATGGKPCLYNVYMMEECHTVLACGAGAVTKLCNTKKNLLERIFNFKYPYEYIDRFDELTARKMRIAGFYETFA